LIAFDSSVLVDFFSARPEPRHEHVRRIVRDGHAVIAPVTLTELLSAPKGGRSAGEILKEFALLPLHDGYWERAGALRAKVLKAGRKAALGDALIAQACIDNDTPLLTRDTDFAAFVKLGGLKLA
jgi:predicted nucleic acid-binding protein